MTEYHKIQTMFNRDPAANYKTVIVGQWSRPEFEYLKDCDWEFTEKVDGTNIRVIVKDGTVEFGGRTDRVQIPAKLVSHLRETLPSEKLAEMFSDGAVLYGAGCGAGIQKGGGNYYPDQRFVLFDVNVGGWWLRRADVEDVAEKLGIWVVPVLAVAPLDHAATLCPREGFNSNWGPFHAEGVVARPPVELKDRAGHRIITKLKCKDLRGINQ